MQAYFCYIKTLKPRLTPESNRILSRYYHCQRQADLRNAARTTIRLLESLIRLAQAHARLMFREVVTVQDAIVAVTCVECSMQNSALLGNMNALHTRFPDEPQEEYLRQATLVLKRLNLEDMVSVINKPAFSENGSPVKDSENNLEENSFSGNVSRFDEKTTCEKRQNSSTHDKNDKFITPDEKNSACNGSDDVDSQGNLTGVFQIQSTLEVGAERHLRNDSNCVESEPEISGQGQRKIGRGETCGTTNGGIFSKPSGFPANLRSIASNKDHSLKAGNRNTVTQSSLEKSKKVIELFSKKQPCSSEKVIDCQSAPVDSRQIFVTEELDDEELEVEWSSNVMSTLQTVSNLNHSMGSLRRRDRTV